MAKDSFLYVPISNSSDSGDAESHERDEKASDHGLKRPNRMHHLSFYFHSVMLIASIGFALFALAWKPRISDEQCTKQFSTYCKACPRATLAF